VLGWRSFEQRLDQITGGKRDRLHPRTRIAGGGISQAPGQAPSRRLDLRSAHGGRKRASRARNPDDPAVAGQLRMSLALYNEGKAAAQRAGRER